MTEWTRRSLAIGGALVAISAFSFGENKLWFGDFLKPRLDERHLALLKALYPNSAAARALGRQYLQIGGRSASSSLRRLQNQGSIVSAVRSGSMAKIAASVELTCREDFCMGRFYCVSGWILAETELDVAALHTLV
jgi:hypothetical protein